MVAIALAVGLPLYSQGAPLLGAAVLGAVCGVLGIWFVARAIHLVLKHVTPPFFVGDPVVVTVGPHTGATGKVTEFGGRSTRSVLVALEDGSGSVQFDLSQIQKP